MRESTGKPGSVGDSHSSRTRVTARLQRPTREPARAAPCRACARRAPLFGLAPGGVYPATPLTRSAVRPYRTFSPLPRAARRPPAAVYFLWHFPWTRVPQALPGTLPCGARTFLRPARALGPKPSGDCLVDSRASSVCMKVSACKRGGRRRRGKSAGCLSPLNSHAPGASLSLSSSARAYS